MPKVALAFFTVAPVYVLIGMLWGGYMGMTGDHTMSPAHAHLNLLVFVQMGIFGAFYALAAGKYSEKLAWINFWLSNAGVLMVILNGNEAIAPAITVGEVAAVLGVATFLANVLKVRKASS